MSTNFTVCVTRVLSDQGRKGHVKITTCRGEVQEDLKVPEFHLDVCYSNLPFMTENPEMVLFASGANFKISIFCTLEINAASNACISI